MITLKTKQFENALKEAKKFYHSKSLLPVLKTVHIFNMGDALIVESTDLEFYYHTSIQVQADSNMEVDTCIDLDTLIKMVGQFDKEMTIESGEGGCVMKSGKKGSNITGIDSNEFPPMPVFDVTACNFVDHAEFSRAWASVKPALSKDEARPMLTIAHVNNDVMEGTDGFRIHQHNFSKPLGLPEFFVHPKIGDAISLMSPETTAIELGIKDSTHFVKITDGITYVIWYIHPEHVGTYPDCSVIFPKNVKNNHKCNVADLLDGLGYLLENKGDSPAILYNSTEKRFEQKIDSDVNTYDFEMGGISFAIDVKYFWEAVKYQYGDCEFLNVGIVANNIPITLTRDDGRSRTALMPMHFE